MSMYVQCNLTRANLQQVAFIPKRFAVAGKVVKLREHGVWVDGWVVTRVSSVALDESQLPDSHEDIKSHRKSTGDADRKQATSCHPI